MYKPCSGRALHFVLFYIHAFLVLSEQNVMYQRLPLLVCLCNNVYNNLSYHTLDHTSVIPLAIINLCFHI